MKPIAAGAVTIKGFLEAGGNLVRYGKAGTGVVGAEGAGV